MPVVAIGEFTVTKLYDGVSISSVQGYYAVSSSDSTPPTNWSTSPQKTTTTNRYLWYYEDITFSDGTKTTTAKRIVGTHGETGGVGTPAPTITKVVTEYYLSTSKTALVGGSWATIPQTWVTGKYYWTRTATTLSNGTVLRSTEVYDSMFTDSYYAMEVIKQDVNGKEGAIMKQPNAPLNPATGLIWVDTSGVPNVAKRWSGTAWIKMSPTEAQEIGAFSDSDGRDLIDRMSSAEQVITAESITNTVLSSEDFSSLFDSKANSEDLLDLATTEQLANQYSSFEALLEQQLGQAYSTLYDRQSELEQLVNSFDFKIQQAGGINMLRNSLGFSGLDFWGDTNDNGRNILVNSNKRGLSGYSGAVLTNTGGVASANGTLGYTVTGTVGTNFIFGTFGSGNSNYTTTKLGVKYVHSMLVRNNATGSNLVISNNLGNQVVLKPQEVKWVYIYGTGNGTQSIQFVFSINTAGHGVNFSFWNPKVEEGTVPTPWSPAPEDGNSTVNDLTTTTQDNALANLGFGSGFVHKAGGVRLIQNITMPAKGQYTMSFFMKKSTSSGTHGGAGIELFSNGSRIAFIGAEEGIAVNEYTKYSYTFDTIPLDISVQMVAWGNINTTVTMSGLIMNIGSLALTWQPFPSEIYNTNVLIDINGITVKNNQTNGYTLITPSEFSGYAQVGSEMRRIFTLNGKTTEVEEILVRTKIRMGSISVLAVNSAKNVGWAFIGQ